MKIYIAILNASDEYSEYDDYTRIIEKAFIREQDCIKYINSKKTKFNDYYSIETTELKQ